MFTQHNNTFIVYQETPSASAEINQTDSIQNILSRIEDIKNNLGVDVMNDENIKTQYEQLEGAIHSDNQEAIKQAINTWIAAIEKYAEQKNTTIETMITAATREKMEQLRQMISTNNPEILNQEAVGATIAAEFSNALGEGSKELVEGVGEFRDQLEEMKRNPIGVIKEKTDVVGEIANMYRKGIEAKNSGGIFGGFVAIFYKAMARIFGKMAKVKVSDLQKSMTPDELKAAGLPVGEQPIEEKDADAEKMKEGVQENMATVARTQTSKFLVARVKEREYSSTLGAFWEGLKDATWGKDEQDRKNQVRKRAGEILAWSTFSKNSIQTILNTKGQQPQEIIKTLGLTVNTSNEVDKLGLEYAIQTVAQNEEFINNIVSKQYPNWKNEKWGDFIESFYKYAGIGAVNTMTNALENIDLSGDDAIGSLKNAFSSVLISRGEDGTLEGVVGEKINTLKNKGINGQILDDIFFSGSGDISISSYRTDIKNKTFDEKTREKIKGLIKKGGFAKDITSMMEQAGLGEYGDELDSGEKLTMSDFLSIYALSEGEKNLDSMTPGQRAQIIPILYKISVGVNPGAFAVDSFTSLFKKANNKYTQEVGQILGEGISNGVYFSVLTAAGVARGSVEAFLELRHKNPAIFYGTIAALGISIFIACRFKGFLVKTGIFTAVLTGIISGALLIAGGK